MIDLSSPAAQDAIAQASTLTTFRPADLQAWVLVASLDDGLAILETYRLAGAPMDVATFDRLMSALALVEQLIGFAIPAVGLANSLRALL